MKEFQRLYKKFVKFHERQFIRDYHLFLGTKDVDKKHAKKIYHYYERFTFLEFASWLRSIVLLGVKNAVKMCEGDLWDTYWILEFLQSEGFAKGEKVSLGELEKYFTPILSHSEIKKIISKRFRIPLSKMDKSSIEEPLKKIGISFEWKEEFDQLPISLDSACFLISRILKRFPLKAPFLFVGDDDFISLFLGLIVPDMPCYVVDLDEEVLSSIEKGAKKLGINIKTEKKDVERGKAKKEVLGFLANPPYTQEGVKSFVNFGVRSLGKKGEMCFLEIGDEALGNRLLFLQKFFTEKNMIIEEGWKNTIFYLFKESHAEERILAERLQKVGVTIRNEDVALVANLIVLRRVPWKLKQIKGKSIYSYV